MSTDSQRDYRASQIAAEAERRLRDMGRSNINDIAPVHITPYFADGETYPSLIGVRADGDEYETAYVKKSNMAEAVDYWKGMYEELLASEEELNYPEHDGRYECPDCGNVVYYDELYGGGWTIYVEDYQILFNNCPKCGKAVER